MDNPLTPNKIRRLINLAEDTRSFSIPRRLLLNDEGNAVPELNQSPSMNYELSSGILDMEQIEVFGEPTNGNESIGSKSTAFNPGEISGRSTGPDDFQQSRHSIALVSLTNEMDKQTNEIQDLMRHSIATEYSFRSKRDLTEDEASLVRKRAPLPVANTNQSYMVEEKSVNNSNLSMGSYFKHRCPDFGKILGNHDSPDRSAMSSAMPSITEVTSQSLQDSASRDTHKFKLDETLDCVPVRQARPDKPPEKQMFNNIEKHTFIIPKDEIEAHNKSVLTFPSISKMPEVPQFSKNVHLNMVTSSPFVPKPVTGASKPTDILIRNMHSSMRLATDDTEGSPENSLSISKIADYLGKQSNVSVSDMLQLKNQKSNNKKQPLTEVHMNLQSEDFHVTNLRDSRKMDTASSAGTVTTVLSLDKLKINDHKVPSFIVTQVDNEGHKVKRLVRSRSPSSKSPSTLSTVQENFTRTSFKSEDSPLHNSKGEVNTSHVRSPNSQYKELDKSVDWHEVVQQKRLKQERLAKEFWADISATAVHGFVGMNCVATVTVSTLTETWLTAKFGFDDLPNAGRDLTIELPRLPIFLSPGKSEQFNINITSNVEMNTTLSFTMYLKDASIDCDLEQQGTLDLYIKMPAIQAMSCDGMNKVTFPPIQEKTSQIKSFVLLSDCPSDLQLELSVSDSVFTIRSVQEIKKTDVNKVLLDRQGFSDDAHVRGKSTNKQICRLTNGNAIKVAIKFNAPKLHNAENLGTLKGVLNVNLFGVSSVLRQVELVGIVGKVDLVVKTLANKLYITNEPTNLTLYNMGSIPGSWCVIFLNCEPAQFQVEPSQFEIRPGALRSIRLTYTGPQDRVTEGTMYFEDSYGTKTAIEVSGGSDKPKSFPIKTNHIIMSWVRTGRKELSLKNSTDKKVHIRCQINGEGFTIEALGLESRGAYCLQFGPGECRPLPIVFAPTSNAPHAATLHLVYDRNSDFSRKVKLFGCPSGEAMRWTGLVTHGDTALVRAVSREPICLQLYNKSHSYAFVSAQVHFNLQYHFVAASARLIGNNAVIQPRSKHTLRLMVDWARVEQRARDVGTSALAAVTALTGAEITRKRILRVLKDNATGEFDISLLNDKLKVLAGQFDKEDPNMDNMLSDFMETKTSLDELIGGLHELTAQIVLPQDFADENTIVINDDTVIEHHTLCDSYNFK